MNPLQQYLDLHDAHLETINEHAPEQLNNLRARARKALSGATLPRRGSDGFEATDLPAAFAPDYGVNINRVDFDIDAANAFRCDVPNLSTCLYFNYNDIPHAGATARRDNGGPIVCSYMEASIFYPELLDRHLGTIAPLDNPTVALNSMLAQDGLLVYIPDGVTAERTIQLVNLLNASQPLMATRRLLIIVGRDAHARMLVCDHTQSNQVPCMTNQVVEIFLDHGATFDLYDLEESNTITTRVNNVYATQQADSNLLLDTITLTNGFTRNNFNINVDGAHAQTQLLGMAIAGGRQLIDNNTLLIHQAPHCQSNEMFKYVLTDQATGAFEGKILVRPDCPRVEAYQGNRNIVASPTARMHTKPQLEIYTDDVRCSHGTTIGQLDEEALFYMRSRGISLPEAKRLLMQAFMSDVIEAVRLDNLRDRLRYLVDRRLDPTSPCNADAPCAACNTQKTTE